MQPLGQNPQAGRTVPFHPSRGIAPDVLRDPLATEDPSSPTMDILGVFPLNLVTIYNSPSSLYPIPIPQGILNTTVTPCLSFCQELSDVRPLSVPSQGSPAMFSTQNTSGLAGPGRLAS